MQSNTDKLTVTAVIIFFELKFAGRGEKDKISDRCFFFDERNRFYRPKPLKTVLVCKIQNNDVIRLKLCKTIELIKCNVCMKYEPSTKCSTPRINENRFMASSLQGSLEPDSKNTDQRIKASVVMFLD